MLALDGSILIVGFVDCIGFGSNLIVGDCGLHGGGIKFDMMWLWKQPV